MTGKRIGLVIGNNYPKWNKDKQLMFAVADAIKMKEILENKDICDFDDVLLLTNKNSRDAQVEVERIFKNVGQDDLVFIYFSGHGKKDFTNDLYLLFEDTDEESPISTSLSFDFINKCRKYPSALRSSVVIVLDCCYSAAAGTKDTNVTETLTSYCSIGTVILTSTGSTGSQTAMEDNKLGHSLFTYYLIEGLEKGCADRNGNGYITIDEWYSYAFERTKEKCSQFPKKSGSVEGTIFIGKNPLKIRENESKLREERLLNNFVDHLPHRILDESLTILRKNYENPSSMEKVEIEIYRLLGSLLEGELSVDNYSIAVQHLKGTSINISPSQNEEPDGLLIPNVSPSQNEMPDDLLTPEVKNDGNAEAYVLSGESEIPKTFTSSSTGMEFILIPTGSFIMGSPAGEKGRDSWEDLVHRVTIEYSFYLGKYPVTVSQWLSIMVDNPSYIPSHIKNDNKPVVNVSWDEIQVFIKKLNEKEGVNKYRLPSEAEWEYACRAGTQTRYSFGNSKSDLYFHAWYYKNSNNVHPVGERKPNPWGLYDMHGNVENWVQDRWHNNYDGAPSDGSPWEDGDTSDRVTRGGSRLSDAAQCRSASRSSCKSDAKDIYTGFRLVRDL